MKDIRKIIHVDMDAFYASIEQRDNPSLKGKPIIVGGDPNRGGVVATCSYEARKFGIHSAMSSMEAYKLCPNVIFVKNRMEVYKQVSNEIMNILYSYSDLVEPLALDEAFLDVTINKFNIKSATIIAKEIKKNIYSKTKLSVSAGVSYNKFLAKVASDFNKPNGLTVITPKTSNIFLESLSIDKFWGVGKVTKNKLNNMGIFTGNDLRKVEKKELINLFNDKGRILYGFARGIDNRKVNPNRIRKSIGKEITLIDGIKEFEDVVIILLKLSEEIEKRLVYNKTKGYTLTIKIKFFDFNSISKRATFEKFIYKKEDIKEKALELLKTVNISNKKIRLLGITISNLFNEKDFNNEAEEQISFNNLKFKENRLYQIHNFDTTT